MISGRGHEPAHILSQGRALVDARPRPGGPARVRVLATPTGQCSPWPADRRPVEHCRHERRRRSPTSARPGTGRGRDGRRRPGDAWDARTAGNAGAAAGIIVAKRQRVQNPGDQWVLMTLEDLATILKGEQ